MVCWCFRRVSRMTKGTDLVRGNGDRIAAWPISRENLSKSVDNPIKSPAIKAMPG